MVGIEARVQGSQTVAKTAGETGSGDRHHIKQGRGGISVLLLQQIGGLWGLQPAAGCGY